MLLVSCSGSDGSLYRISGSKVTQDVSPINRTRKACAYIETVFPFDCTGITKSQNHIYAFSNTLKSILKFNYNFMMKTYQTVGNDFHGLVYHKGYLYGVDTYNDKICKYDADTLKELSAWSFGESNIFRDNDLFHINDIFITDDDIMFISMFQDERFQKEKVSDNTGKIYRKSLNDEFNSFGELFYDNLVLPHTPVLSDNEFYVCNSKRGSIIINGCEKELNLGFTRGILVGKDYIYIGISNSVKRVECVEFDKSSCGLAIMDRKSKYIIDFIPLPSNEVYGVLWI
jgi:hypothetical protein